MVEFTYRDDYGYFVAEVDGVLLCCDEVQEGYNRKALEFAAAYKQKLPDIAAFMLDEVCLMYGEMSVQELIDALGTPLISIHGTDGDVISYLEHTLDDYHIIDVEFSGLFEQFDYISFNG